MSDPIRTATTAFNRPSGGILAGGEGRRFGGLDKGWIDYQGRPFVEHVLERLGPQVASVSISANRNLNRYSALGCPVLTDRFGAGPLAGLLRLMETSPLPWLFAVPCDALDLPADLSQRFAEIQQNENADIVVLQDDDGIHPIVSLSRCDLWPDLEQFLADGGRSVKRWQSRHRLAYAVRVGRLSNINDPLALAALAPEPVHG